MRIRSIKPEFWRSDDTASLTDWHHRLIFVGLWSYVDDNGVGRDNAALIMADLFPQDPKPEQVLARIQRALVELSNRKMIVRYKAENKDFLFITNWHHQKIDRPSKPRYPEPVTSDYVDPIEPSRDTIEPSLRAREDQGSGIKGSGIKGSRDQAAEFDQFWIAYPRKDDKPRALKAWPKATATADASLIITGAIRYANDPNRDDAFTKQPATWLNAECWNNPPLPRRSGGSARAAPGRQQSTTDQRVSGTLALAAEYAAEANHQNRPQIGSR